MALADIKRTLTIGGMVAPSLPGSVRRVKSELEGLQKTQRNEVNESKGLERQMRTLTKGSDEYAVAQNRLTQIRSNLPQREAEIKRLTAEMKQGSQGASGLAQGIGKVSSGLGALGPAGLIAGAGIATVAASVSFYENRLRELTSTFTQISGVAAAGGSALNEETAAAIEQEAQYLALLNNITIEQARQLSQAQERYELDKKAVEALSGVGRAFSREERIALSEIGMDWQQVINATPQQLLDALRSYRGQYTQEVLASLLPVTDAVKNSLLRGLAAPEFEAQARTEAARVSAPDIDMLEQSAIRQQRRQANQLELDRRKEQSALLAFVGNIPFVDKGLRAGIGAEESRQQSIVVLDEEFFRNFNRNNQIQFSDMPAPTSQQHTEYNTNITVNQSIDRPAATADEIAAATTEGIDRELEQSAAFQGMRQR